MQLFNLNYLATGLALLGLTSAVRADVKLPHAFGDHMVLQQGKPLNFWGWSDPGETVTVQLGNQSQGSSANDKGEWRVSFPSRTASSNPLTVTVSGKNTLTLNDVLIGEVWLCAGQSNMYLNVGGCLDAQNEIAAAKYPLIRTLPVSNGSAAEPLNDVAATWKVCSPETADGFSAAAYFFGRQIYKELNVPVGLIVAAAGGSSIESWTPVEGYASVPSLPVPKWPPDKYNSMIAPLRHLSLRGIIWYQGEANHKDGPLYIQKTQVQVEGFRRAFDQPDLPYYYTMIAPFDYEGEDPSILPTFWEAQAGAMSIPHTGMIVTSDIGDASNIHPRNKQEVGRRLALWALAKTYGRKGIICSGPTFSTMTSKTNRLIVKFDHVDEGLLASDGKPLRNFELRDANQEGYVAANAEIAGNSVILTAPGVNHPVAVRFAWNKAPDANLTNGAHLPAIPFRAGEASVPIGPEVAASALK